MDVTRNLVSAVKHGAGMYMHSEIYLYNMTFLNISTCNIATLKKYYVRTENSDHRQKCKIIRSRMNIKLNY